MKAKILTTTVVAGCLLVSFATITFAAKKDTAVKANVVEQTATPSDWRQEAADKAHKALSAHEWTIYVTARDTKGGVETDVLTFANGKVTSRNLSAQGYPQSNYGLSIQDDGSATWETMQAKELPDHVDLAFLRGQLFADGSMNGSISMQPAKGPRKGFDYSTSQVTATQTKKR